MNVPVLLLVVAALAWITGYLAVAATSFLLTFGITSTVPRFVAHAGRMSGAYLIVQAGVWLLSSAIGGWVTGTIAGAWQSSVVAALLAVSLIGVNWLNTAETSRQDGVPHRVLLSALTIVGVMGGYLLRIHK